VKLSFGLHDFGQNVVHNAAILDMIMICSKMGVACAKVAVVEEILCMSPTKNTMINGNTKPILINTYQTYHIYRLSLKRMTSLAYIFC